MKPITRHVPSVFLFRAVAGPLPSAVRPGAYLGDTGDAEAEAALAVTIVNRDGAWEALVAAGITPEMFLIDHAARVVRAAAAVAAAGSTVTPVAIAAQLGERVIPRWSDPALTRSVAEVPVLARRVRESWERRRLADLAVLLADGKVVSVEAARAHLAQLDSIARVRGVLPDSLIPAGRLLDARYDPVQFAIVPYFPRGEITELTGAHGIFKSTCALAACLCVAAGRSWGGAQTPRGRAVFITMEDSERALAQRVRAWLDGIADQERGDAEAAVREHFAFLAREQARALTLTQTDRMVTVPRAPVIECVAQLVQGAALVVLETAARLHDGPEVNEALAVFAQAIEDIAARTSAALCVVRHVSKEAARQRFVDSYVGRGGGALSDAARSVLVMTRDRGEEEGDGEPDPFTPVRLVHTKATHTAAGVPIIWKPTSCEHGVYLRHVSAADETRDAAERLHAHLRNIGDRGITKADLHKAPPAGLGRAAAKRAMAHLIETRRAVEEEQPGRGANRQGATIYRATPRPT